MGDARPAVGFVRPRIRRGGIGALALLAALALSAVVVPAARGEGPKAETRWRRDGRPRERKRQIRVATFNVQNLYRYRPDVEANYFPKSQREYRDKLNAVARTIVDHIGRADVIALQEVENHPAALVDHAKRPKVIKDLKREIKRISGIDYSDAGSPGINDARGISQWFLYDPKRVRLRSVKEDDPLFGANRPGEPEFNRAVRNPKSFDFEAPKRISRDNQGQMVYGRPLLVGLFEVFRDGVEAGGPSELLTIFNTHQKSNPRLFKKRRSRQAKHKAQLIREISDKLPQSNVIVTGDFNVDMHTPEHREQMRPLLDITPAGGAGTPNLLFNLGEKLGRDGHTYVYRKREQLLDWMLASPALARRISEIFIPHVNSRDRESSDHDPVVATFDAF